MSNRLRRGGASESRGNAKETSHVENAVCHRGWNPGVCAAVARAESESVAALLKDLGSGDESVRLRAIDLLGEQAAATPEVLGALAAK